MPLSPCCKRKYSKPCKCRSQCNNCECIVQTGQCPPSSTTETEEDVPVLYTPVIAAAPTSKKCCCTECCEEKKQRKSLWQQLFGDRKCCSPCQKKKQDCLCNPKKKQKCLSECTNQLCCSGCKPFFPSAPKPCKPLCCCKVKTCKCKTSCKPICPTPTSLFGCHFFCNVENRENQTKQSRCRCCCCCTCKKKKILSDTSEVTSAVPVTSEDEKIVDSYIYSKNTGKGSRSIQSTAESRKKTSFNIEDLRQPSTRRETLEQPSEIKRQSVDKPIQKLSVDRHTHSKIHIGLTFTNAETKYYKKDSIVRPAIKEDTEYNNNENEESSGSSEQIMTLEIHQSDEKISQDKNERQESSQNRDEETTSINSSKRRKLSKVEEENNRLKIKSESYSREILPLIERRSRVEHLDNSFDSLTRKREKRTLSIRRQDPDRLENNELDKRVSEILKRLQTIENKINKIDMNQTENTIFKTDVDDNKSTIYFRLNDGKYNDSFDTNNSYRANNTKNFRTANAVIEIRKTRSKSYSPVRKHESKKYHYSRSLDRCIRVQREKPKLVIKLPHGNKVSQGVVSVSNSNKVKYIDRDYQDSEWMEISNELKNRKDTNTRCYCYECVCQRTRCR